LTCITNLKGEVGDEKVKLDVKIKLYNINIEFHVQHGVEVLCWTDQSLLTCGAHLTGEVGV
jgi:hypothetical protein